jgi:hypothetical protein
MRSGGAGAVAILLGASALHAASACGSFSADAPATPDATDDGRPTSDGGGGSETSTTPDGSTSVDGLRIYVIGGESPNADPDASAPPTLTSSVAFTTQSADGGLAPWTETQPYSVVHGNTAVATTGAIVTLGGEVQTPFSTSASTLVSRAANLGDAGLDVWLATQTLPAPLYFHASVTLNGFVYTVGGRTVGTPALPTVRFATLAANGTVGPWADSAQLPSARSRAAAATDGTHVFVVGGVPHSAGTCPVSDDVLVGTQGQTGEIVSWAVAGGVAPLTSPAIAVFAKKLYVLGGFGCLGTSTAVTIYDIDPSGRLVKSVLGPALPGPRSGLGAVILGHYLYAVGGNDGSTRVPDVLVADLDAEGNFDSWHVVAAMPVGRSLFGIAGAGH